MQQTGFVLLDEWAENTRAVIHLDDEDTIKVGPRTFRKRILRYGKWSHSSAPGGVLDVDRAFAKRLTENFRNGVWDTCAVTLGHPQSEKDGVANSVGHVVVMEEDDDGVWATVEVDADTAPKIGTSIKGCSAGLIPNYVDHEVNGRGDVGPVCGHLALTNEPYIKGLGDFAPVHLAHDSDAVLLSRYEPDPEVGMTKEELLAAAKELGLTVDELAKHLGIEIIDADAHKSLEDELAELKKEQEAKPPVVEEAKEEAQAELVAALGEALVGAKVIELSEGETPSLKTVVAAIVGAVQDGNTAKIALAENEAEQAVTKAIREGKVLPAQKDALKKVFLTDKATFEALLPATAVVPLDERGNEGVDLEEPGTPGAVDTAKEIDRYAEMAKAV